VLVVRGEAGIGKSALVQHLVDAASDFRVLRVNGVESEMALPFAALHQLCASTLDHVDALPAPQREAANRAFGLTDGTAPDRLLIGWATFRLLSQASDAAPLLCIVDDAQWLDRESMQALAFVARRFLADPVGFVFATRHLPKDFAAFPELVVEPLADGDAKTLLSSVLHVQLDERVRDRVVAETRGNPLALVEWPRGRTPAELTGGFGMPPTMAMAGQIEESFRRRVLELPAPTQRFLTIAAAEPTGDLGIVLRAANSLKVEARDANPAIDAGLLEIDTRVTFRHPLVRSAAYGAAKLGDRQEGHRALAEATDPALDPDRQAWHRALGSPGPDEVIADALEQSAQRALARGGFAAAGALLERAAGLTLDPTRRTDRLVAAAAAHLDAGSFEAVSELLAAAEATTPDEMRRVQLETMRARLATFGGNLEDSPQLLHRAAQRLEPLDANLALLTHLHAMSTAVVVGALGRGPYIREIGEAALRCPRPPTPGPHELLTVGLAQATVAGFATAVPTLQRALSKEGDDSFGDSVHWLGWEIGAACILWDIDAFHELSFRFAAKARELGSLSMLPSALECCAHVFGIEGDLSAASFALAEVEQINGDMIGSNLPTSFGAILAGLQGGDDAARAIEEQLAIGRARGSGEAVKIALWGSALLHNGMGQSAPALAAATEAMQHPWEWAGMPRFAELIEAAVRCEEREVANEALARLKDSTEPSGTDWAIGVQRRSEALLADGDSADDLYRKAIEHLARTPLRPDLARAHLLYGEWLRLEDRRVDARSHLLIAHELFTEVGMRAFAERTRHELAATGETVRKQVVEKRDALTSQEAHIAQLAADGFTNPEIGEQLFISHRTVEFHLRKVYTKLGVTSRRQLREVLPRQRRLTATK
jgi:DNA-binding CsgD family transcriptional regulator